MSEKILDFEKPIADLEKKIEEMRMMSLDGGVDLGSEIRKMEEKLKKQIVKIHSGLSRWQKVQLARHPNRPHSLDYIKYITTDFVELHGDRYFADDEAIIAGLAMINNEKVFIISQQKGRNTKEKLRRNFGMPHPEGYRKALRIMKMAEKFKRPIITLIDTLGAYPGIGAEERGQAEAIAKNLFEMASLNTPIINVIIGEGASGGALGIGIGDRLLLLDNTWYSVITPEGCASILYRDAAKAPLAAESMKVTSKDVKELGIADEIIPEPLGGAHRAPAKMADILKKSLLRNIKALKKIPLDELVNSRIEKISKMGSWSE